MRLQSYAQGEWVTGTGRRDRAVSRGDGREDRGVDQRGPRLQGHAGVRPPGRRAEAAGDDVPPASPNAQGHGPASHGREGGALPGLGGHRGNQGRFLGRHRGWHRHLLRVRQSGAPRVPRRDLLRRRIGRAALEGGQLPRPASVRAARGGGGPHQRLQLPLLGNAGEARSHLPRRDAGDRQAGHRDVVPHRADGAQHGERGDPPGGRAPDHLRRRGRPARPPDLPGRRHLHRLFRAPAASSRVTRA